MNERNRVECFYETACDYLDLSVNSKFLIGTHFQIVKDKYTVFDKSETMDETIFKAVFERGIYEEFKRLVGHFKKSGTHDYRRI